MAHPDRLARGPHARSLAALAGAALLAALLAAPVTAHAVDDGAASAPAPRAFGAACAGDSDCDSGMCRPFRGHSVQLCTRPCTIDTQADDCPQPLTSGYCSRAGYCRF